MHRENYSLMKCQNWIDFLFSLSSWCESVLTDILLSGDLLGARTGRLWILTLLLSGKWTISYEWYPIKQTLKNYSSNMISQRLFSYFILLIFGQMASCKFLFPWSISPELTAGQKYSQTLFWSSLVSPHMMWRGRVVIIPFASLDVSSLNDLRTGFVFFKCLKHKTNEINNWRRPVLVHTALLNTGIWAVNVNLSQWSTVISASIAQKLL